MKKSFCILLGVEFINLSLAKSSSTLTGGASARSQIRNTDDKAEPKKKAECRKDHYIYVWGHSQTQRKLEACWRRDGLDGQISVHFSPDIISALATPAKSYLSLILLHMSLQFPNWEHRKSLWLATRLHGSAFNITLHLIRSSCKGSIPCIQLAHPLATYHGERQRPRRDEDDHRLAST